MNPEHLREDLKQELFIILCEKSETFIEDLYSKGHLKFYVTRIVLNMIASNTSPFYKKFRTISVEYSDNSQAYSDGEEGNNKLVLQRHLNSMGVNKHLLFDRDDAAEKEYEYQALVDAVNKALDKLEASGKSGNYAAKLFKDYIRCGSAGKVIKEFQDLNLSPIPKRSILATVKDVKNFIKEEVKKSA